MGKTIGRIFGALAAVVALAVGILGLVPICPKAVWNTLGALGLVFIIGQYVWESQSSEAEVSPRRVGQTQKGGQKSTNNQAARDININQLPRDELP